MKRLLFLLLLPVISAGMLSAEEKRITILHTNDLHSRLTGYAPESDYSPLTINDDQTTGGFARIAGIIRSEKEKGSTLVVDAGDFTMGTLFHSLESETGFQLRLMKKMGFDAVGLGNHEFDFGPAWIAAVVKESHSRGEIPAVISSNLEFDEKDNRDDGLEQVFADKLISSSVVLEKEGIRIGIFSLVGKDASEVAPRAAPVKFGKQTAAAKKMVKELSAKGCEIIICLSHSGLVTGKNGELSGEDADIARKVRGIDLIVGGHSHTKLDKPLFVNGVPIVQTGEFGKNIGRLQLVLSGGKVKIEKYDLIPVDDRIKADPAIDQMIGEQKVLVTGKILAPLGLSFQKPVAKAGFIIEGNDLGDYKESNLGPLVADAIHYYVNKNSGPGTDVSMVAAGMLFDRIVPGMQTAADIFRIMPLGSGSDSIPGYPLSRLYVTGKELKSILEILQVAYKSSPDNYCYYSGIHVDYNPDKGLLRKINKIRIVKPDGSAKDVDFDKKNKTLYSITANAYMLEFIGIIKKMSFGLINVVPRDAEGNRIHEMKKSVIDIDEKREGIQEGKEWLALIDLFNSMEDADNDGVPEIDRKYSTPVRCFFITGGK